VKEKEKREREREREESGERRSDNKEEKETRVLTDF
jgi:hypothetical protein